MISNHSAPPWSSVSFLMAAFGINSILYQRGIYPPETFTRVNHYDMSMLVTTDANLKKYLSDVVSQLKGALVWFLGKWVECLWKTNCDQQQQYRTECKISKVLLFMCWTCLFCGIQSGSTRARWRSWCWSSLVCRPTRCRSDGSLTLSATRPPRIAGQSLHLLKWPLIRRDFIQIPAGSIQPSWGVTSAHSGL